MTREDALLKLLAVEPATRAELHMVTGWGIEETNELLDGLLARGRVTFRNSMDTAGGGRSYMPARERERG